MGLVVVDIVFGLIALLYVGWTIVGIKSAKISLGKNASVYYAQAVVVVACVGVIYGINSGRGAIEAASWGLIALATVCKAVNIRRLTVTEAATD